MEMKYDFFNAYLCIVCKSKDSFYRSKACSGCTLVSYCSREHQKADWKRHKNICRAVQKVCVGTGGENLYVSGLLFILMHDQPTMDLIESSKRVPKPVWKTVKENVKIFLEKQLNRTLDYLEMQMVYSPKHCAVCFTRINIKKDSVCLNCFGVAYCSPEHQASDNHQGVCSDLRKALDMDLFLQKINLDSQEISLIKPEQASNLKLDACNMSSFIQNYIQPGLTLEEETLISYYYTSVLTFAYIINQIPRLTLEERLVIHIVGATQNEEGRQIKYWENLLHLFPRLRRLLIFHVGPGIGGFPCILELCNDCCRADKSIECLFLNQLYHDYHNGPLFVKPNVIVAFNSGLYDGDNPNDQWDWGPSLPFFFKYDNVAFISTDWTQELAESDLEKLLSKQVIGEKKVKTVVKCEKNPFSNLRRVKCCEDDTLVLIKNMYVSALIVEND